MKKIKNKAKGIFFILKEILLEFGFIKFTSSCFCNIIAFMK